MIASYLFRRIRRIMSSFVSMRASTANKHENFSMVLMPKGVRGLLRNFFQEKITNKEKFKYKYRKYPVGFKQIRRVRW